MTHPDPFDRDDEKLPPGLQATELSLRDMAIAADLGLRALAAAHEKVPAAPQEGYLVTSDPEILDQIVNGLRHAATIGRTLDGPPHFKAKQDQRNFHARRQKLLFDVLKGVDVGALLDRNVRHSLEHFDEHVDRLSLERNATQTKDRRPIVYNLVLSNRRTFGANPHFARVLIADEDRFFNLGYEVHLAPVREALARVKAALKDREPGGLIYP